MNKIRLTSSALALMLSSAVISAAESSSARTSDVVSSIVSVEPSATPLEGAVEITAPGHTTMTFQIFSITGQLVRTVNLTDETLRVELPRGCYIIKCGRWSKKIMVR